MTIHDLNLAELYLLVVIAGVIGFAIVKLLWFVLSWAFVLHVASRLTRVPRFIRPKSARWL